MKPVISRIAVPVFIFALLSSAAWPQPASSATTPYPSMAPLQQYLMPEAAEIALARSAGPESIAHDAEVLVLREHGYATAVHGSNGFVCLVERGWVAPLDNSDFWNPKLRGPLCLNAAAARTYLPITVMKTKLILEESRRRRCPTRSKPRSTASSCLRSSPARCATCCRDNSIWGTPGRIGIRM